MPPVTRPTHARFRSFAFVLVAAGLGLAARPHDAGAVKFMNYNLLNWSASAGPGRVPYMRAITRVVAPDLIVSQEVLDQGGVDLFRDQVLNAREPGQWASAPFVNGPDTDCALFYRTSTWDYLDMATIPTELRNAYRYHLRLDGYSSPEAELYVYSFHLKASQGSAEEAQRRREMNQIRNDAETLPVGSHVVFCGDYNVYTSAEAAYQQAMKDTLNNVGRMKDPINQPGAWHDGASFAGIHTQSPRTNSFGGGSTGGMDDRFDFILQSYNLDDGQGMDMDESTYRAFGNDGQHLNVAINALGFNNAVGLAMADSLEQASDHIPVICDFVVPSKCTIGPGPIAFGTVIVGASVESPLTVTNTAAIPGDALDYSIDVTPGFTAAGGPFAVPAGAEAQHQIGLDTSTPGTKTGAAEFFTDAPDQPFLSVDLSGAVLAHARPSTQQLAVEPAGILDFGEQSAGGFSDLSAVMWNANYDPLTAVLWVNGASITGGDGRFTLVEPFVAEGLTDGSKSMDVHFDDTDATTDSTYTATLTITSEDQPGLPGAAPLGDVQYQLLARVSGSLVDVDTDVLPAVTILFAPAPNPAYGGRVTFRFDMAQAGRASVELYDVRGRKVATLADGDRPAGHHSVTWAGRDQSGHAVQNGVYFARFKSGAVTQSVRFLVLD